MDLEDSGTDEQLRSSTFQNTQKNRNRLINHQRKVESNTDTLIFPGANSDKILSRSKISNLNRKIFPRNLPQDAVQGLNLGSGPYLFLD